MLQPGDIPAFAMGLVIMITGSIIIARGVRASR